MSAADERMAIPGGPGGGVSAEDTTVVALGPCEYESPVLGHLGESALTFVGTADQVLVNDQVSEIARAGVPLDALPAFELAGPRRSVFFNPKSTRVGIVTCGGLCPGLNNVVRGIVFELWFAYGVRRIWGFPYGYEGLTKAGRPPVALNPQEVLHIHEQGGTFLGSSRGNQDSREIVDQLDARGIDILFVIGGDGTIRGAQDIVGEANRRELSIGVVAVPKTIDNDIHFIDRSFGFESAYSAAVDVISAAHVEATGARNGIGLVKVMGRHSGFVACRAVLASARVDLVLIPEMDFVLEGETGILRCIERILERQGYAVVVVAEGVAQEELADASQKDKSGNVKLADSGLFMKSRISEFFAGKSRDVSLKYIDPSYTIRSVPATPSDAVYCWNMARNAVHAAMAGNTEMLIGRWHGRFVHVPMHLATRARKHVDLHDDLWMSVIEATGQPREFTRA